MGSPETIKRRPSGIASRLTRTMPVRNITSAACTSSGSCRQIIRRRYLVPQGCGAGLSLGPNRSCALYLVGKYVPQNYALGVSWYRKAAERGNPDGQVALASLYEDGEAVQQSYSEAYFWMSLAAANPELSGVNRSLAEEHANERDRIGSHMTLAQRQKVQSERRNGSPNINRWRTSRPSKSNVHQPNEAAAMNLKEGTRRLALILGIVGVIIGGLVSLMFLQDTFDWRARYNRFEQLASSPVVQQEKKSLQQLCVSPNSGICSNSESSAINREGINTVIWG